MWLDLLRGRRFTAQTAWSPAEIEARLARPPSVRAVRGADGENGWAGWCRAGRFRLARPSGSRGVVAAGRFCVRGLGSEVEVTLRLSLAATAMLFLAFPLATALSVVVTLAALARREPAVVAVWLLPITVGPRVARALSSELREAEAGVRGLFPPAPPPSVGPFR
jgi:hypothetical protein